MPIYEFAPDEIRLLRRTTFEQVNLRERKDLQRLLRANISVIAPGAMVISEEFGDWEESRRRIDLLAIDRSANLVVVELKRTEDGGHMELQAIRYAAMVSAMTFEQAADIFARYLAQIGSEGLDARSELLDFLGWEDADEDLFGQDVRIVLAAAEFGRELTTSVLWLVDRGIDIRCVRLQPYILDDRVLVDVAQIIPLPEATEYQVRIAEKKRKERESRSETSDWTRYDLALGTRRIPALRKRHVIYRTFRHLVSTGVPPERIAEHLGPMSKRGILSLEGHVAADEFCRLMTEERAATGRIFEPKRYFISDDELVHFDGRTYAFSSQWSGTKMLAAMGNLRSAFPDAEIDFAPTE